MPLDNLRKSGHQGDEFDICGYIVASTKTRLYGTRQRDAYIARTVYVACDNNNLLAIDVEENEQQIFFTNNSIFLSFPHPIMIQNLTYLRYDPYYRVYHAVSTNATLFRTKPYSNVAAVTQVKKRDTVSPSILLDLHFFKLQQSLQHTTSSTLIAALFRYKASLIMSGNMNSYGNEQQHEMECNEVRDFCHSYSYSLSCSC